MSRIALSGPGEAGAGDFERANLLCMEDDAEREDGK